MQGVLVVAAGGVVGAVARYLVYLAVGHWIGTGFPYATLIVNVVGSFAMGVLIETMALVWSTSNEMRLFLAVGMLGSFTTFSTFSLDFAFLYERREWLLSAVYAASSVVLSIAALFGGLHVVRRLVPPPF